MSMDCEKEITQIAGMIEPDVKLAPETIRIAAGSIEEVDRRYGPGSDNPLVSHDAPHSLGAVRRGVRLANFFYPYIKPRQRARIFDLTIVAEATHDLEQLLGSGQNEEASTEQAIAKIEAEDGILNNQRFKDRIGLGHLATVVEVKEDGSVVQVNLLTGSRDPIKIITAYGDIGAIGMEGDKAMWNNGANVYYESADRTGEEPTIEGLYHFLVHDETAFIRSQFNYKQVETVVARYFPDDAEEIYNGLQKRYRDNIDYAFKLAVKLGEHPELEKSIGRIVGVADRSAIGPLIGKMIRRKVLQDQ